MVVASIAALLITILVVGAWLNKMEIDRLAKNKPQTVERVSINSSDFKFLIEAYLGSLEHESLDARKIREELLHQIKSVVPNWRDNFITVHERG